MLFLLVFISIAIAKTIDADPSKKKFEPKWKDLDTRVLPQWYDEAKVGIFLHWGVYSVPAFGYQAEWFWFFWHQDVSIKTITYMKKNYPPGFTYQEFAPMFKAELFYPYLWAELFVNSGAKYVVLTSKHHDGYTLFPSKYSPNWNSVDVGPKRDLVKELAEAVRKRGLKFGLYYSLLEWAHPLYNIDLKNITNLYTNQKLLPEIKQLVNDYSPSVLWSDGDWDAPDYYWKSQEFLAWLYNDSPVKDEVVVNDRWGLGKRGKHGDFYNFDDRFNNETLQRHKWENAFSIDTRSWGYRHDLEINLVLSMPDIIHQLVTTVSCGGNVLINVGPTKEGTIPLIFQERLLSLGKWLAINGEAIYKSSPWLYQNDVVNHDVWYTCSKTKYNARRPTEIPTPDDNVTAIYAIMLKWPSDNMLELRGASYLTKLGDYQVELLGKEGKYRKWTTTEGVAQIQLPEKSTLKSEYAWTLKFTKQAKKQASKQVVSKHEDNYNYPYMV